MVPEYPFIGERTECKEIKLAFPPQHQRCQPGMEYQMNPRPISADPYAVSGYRLIGRTAVITGGDSGIGRAVALSFAREGADVAIVYLCEEIDALETKAMVEQTGRRCLLIRGDLTEDNVSKDAVKQVIDVFGQLDILVNNHGVQYIRRRFEDISAAQLLLTFRTNIFPFFYMTQAALPFMKRGGAIINTASVTAYRGDKDLIDYSASKGAVVSFTRSLSLAMEDRGIRVNAVAPGPIWTPLIPASYTAQEVETFGTGTAAVPMKRAGQPFEAASSYVFLASDDASYMTGQVLHPNGGTIVGS